MAVQVRASVDGTALVEVEWFEVVVFVLVVGGFGGAVEVGVAQDVGAFFPVEAFGPFAVLGDGDGAVRLLFAAGDGFHRVVVDEKVAAVVAGEADVVGVVAEGDGDDFAGVAVVAEVDADHDRSFVPYPPAHGLSFVFAGRGVGVQRIDVGFRVAVSR